MLVSFDMVMTSHVATLCTPQTPTRSQSFVVEMIVLMNKVIVLKLGRFCCILSIALHYILPPFLFLRVLLSFCKKKDSNCVCLCYASQMHYYLYRGSLVFFFFTTRASQSKEKERKKKAPRTRNILNTVPGKLNRVIV